MRAALSPFACLLLLSAVAGPLPLRAQIVDDDAALSPALADADGVVRLPDIVLTAAQQTDVVRGRTGASVEVLDRAFLAAPGRALLADRLATLPGVTVTTNGPFGSSGTIRLRGLPGEYVAVLVDGIDVSSTASPRVAFDPGAWFAADAGQVEVLKGPQSALYGSEAVGGVIAVTSLRPDADGLSQQVQAEAGRYGTARGQWSLSHAGTRHALTVTAARLVTDGFSAADAREGNTEADGAAASRVSAALRYDLSDRVTVGGAAFWQDLTGDYDASGPTDGPPPYAERYDARTRGARLFAEIATGAVSHAVSVQRSETDRNDVSDFGPFRSTGRRTEVAYEGNAPVGSGTLSWGRIHARESFGAGSDRQGVIVNGTVLELVQAPRPDLDLSLSLRRDDHARFGAETTGRLALAWRPADGWTMRAQAGTGYRAPSPYELFGAFVGNPALTPERARGLDLGVEWQRGDGTALRATAFATRIEDLIAYDSGTFVYVQTQGRSRSRGVELSAERTLAGGVALAGNVTWTDATGPDGAPLPRAARWTANLRVDAPLGQRWRVGAAIRHAAGVVDFNGPLPDYTVVDVSAEVALSDRARATLRLENATDADYQVARGYGTPGRSLYAGLRADF